MKNQLWVFRLSVTKSGDPVSDRCPAVDPQKISDLISLKLKEEDVGAEDLEGFEIEEVDEEDLESDEEEFDDEELLFLKTELFEHGRLRQGWGYEFKGIDTDLAKPRNVWIQNYIALNRIFWNEETPEENACGRLNILRRMNKMKEGDIVFIPRIPDSDKFTVATVNEDEYYFQPVEESFTHANIIGVKNIKAYIYEDHFPAKKFNPYRSAISQIKDHHKAFDLCGFVDRVYSKDIDL